MNVRTPSQTIGPFFHVGLEWNDGNRVAFAAPGAKIAFTGHVYDGLRAVIADAMIETWQADADGNIPVAGSSEKPHGYSRAATDANGQFVIETVMPGACVGADGQKYAPQIQVTIFARGLLKAVRTRVFLAAPAQVKDDPLARASGSRVSTLMAVRDSKDPAVWQWDVRLQGADETAFIDF